MIRTLIIDDEQHCIDRVTHLLEAHKDKVHLMDALHSVEEGITAIKKFKPDLIFLDVQINDKTGFDLLKQIDTHDFEVIFTTAHDKYAVQAFKFSAIDYLLKPVDADDLQQALEKVFHALIKTYFSTELFLEPADLYQSDAFEKGQRYINIHSLQEQQLMNENVKPLFSPIGKDGTVILNFTLHQSSFSLDKIQDLTEIIIEHLGEKFDGEIFYSCNATSKPEQSDLIYLSYLSA